MATSVKQYLPALNDMDILMLTKCGEQELREPGTTLSSAQLEALVLIGDRSTVAQVLKHTHSLAPDVLRASLSELIDKKLVSVNAELGSNLIDPGDFFSLGKAGTATPEVSEQINADIVADTEFLRQNGYYVNIVRRPMVQHNRPDGRTQKILVIEDDPDICKVLRICLRLEGFDTHTAAKSEEIVAAFRLLPLPDLVLLDIGLPDINGFDILAKIRQHPILKELPVIMLTAVSTREAVLKGILGGADGFVTKPFQIENLVKAVKTVLGLMNDTNN